MKIAIRKEVSTSQVFQHLIAAWDYAALPWYRKVAYTDMGRDAIDGVEPPEKVGRYPVILATVEMDRADGEEGAGGLIVKVTADSMRRALEKCIAMGGVAARQAMRVIEDSVECDQDTADCIMQIMAYGELVFD